jgi:hypothetical protein
MKVFTELTRSLPLFRSHAYERAVVRLASGPVGGVVGARGRVVLKRVRRLRRALVVADVNIGDAILLQPAVAALRHRFPSCRVDFAFNHKLAALLGADPEIDTALPVLHGGTNDPDGNLERIRSVLRKRDYDLVISFCPFIGARRLNEAGCPVVTPLGFAVELLRAVADDRIAAMPFRAAAWVDRLAEQLPAVAPARSTPAEYGGTRVFLPPESLEAADGWLAAAGIEADEAAVFVNPDTSNYSTFLGADLHVALIRELLASGRIDAILLGRGFTYVGVEDEILGSLDPGERARVHRAPPGLSLEELAAVIDRCGAYVGGDTGPLHIAAARKVAPPGAPPAANRTAVVGVFKATEPRIYGYDSARRDMIGSSQQAPAVAVDDRPNCKNLTCSVQRISSSCPAVACHERLDGVRVARAVLGVLSSQPGEGWLPATATRGF